MIIWRLDPFDIGGFKAVELSYALRAQDPYFPLN